MKFTLSWLKNHLDTDADIDTIGARLTMLGLEVEDIDDRAKDLAPFTVAYVKRRSRIRTPTSCGSASSRRRMARTRSSAARPMRAPA